MASTGREWAKFFAGLAFDQTLGHWLFGLFWSELFPLKIGWFTFTATFNYACMAVWPLLTIALVYIAWYRRPAAPCDPVMPHTPA